ncbi:hypothetical protein NHG24_07790 [Aerococcaceae bacterium NML210727]|nr:hypothetical protein [Aerococcaceae bacterium NML210727]MCW6655090.1 hypothetical protein [Aerococcaceae bacterium NML201296]
MNEKATEQTIAELALQYAQEKLNRNTFKEQANEQIMNLEAVLRDKEAEIQLLQDELNSFKAVKSNAVQD